MVFRRFNGEGVEFFLSDVTTTPPPLFDAHLFENTYFSPSWFPFPLKRYSTFLQKSIDNILHPRRWRYFIKICSNCTLCYSVKGKNNCCSGKIIIVIAKL